MWAAEDSSLMGLWRVHMGHPLSHRIPASPVRLHCRTSRHLLCQSFLVQHLSALQDAEDRRARRPLTGFVDHLFNHLEAVYGTKAMVNQLAACLMVTLEKFKPSDLRLQVGCV